MKGKLTDQPLAELIRELASKGLSGALRLELESAKTVVYFEKGRIVFAASNLRTLRLREYLKEKGLISESEYEKFENPGGDLSMGSALCAMGKLSERDFNSMLASLVADVLRVALLWTAGDWELDERARLDGPVRVPIEPTSLLKEAAQRLPLQFVSLRFRNPNEIISRCADGSATNSFLPAESFILSRLDKPTKLEELVVVSGLSELDAYRVIYGLALSGFVEREFWQNAFRTAPGSAIADKKPLGALSLPGAADTKPKVVDRWAQQDAVSEDNLGGFLERLREATSFYEVLDITPNAGNDEIKEAYYALARRYHPDRFHLKSGTRLHEQISSTFARITQAYETLIDANSRSTYDAGMQRSQRLAEAGSGPGGVERAPFRDREINLDADSELGQAERDFREGFDYLDKGQPDLAVSYLAAASRLDPQQAKYRAHYGRALAANEQTRRLAESEIQTAVKLEPSNPLYRTMLAELYFDLGFHRRAQTELDRALELDSNSARANNLRRKLLRLRKVK